jgi:ATP-dependent Lon protease
VSGLLKLICPAGDYEKEIVRKCLEYALETRRRVKEQLKKIGGMEFYDVHFLHRSGGWQERFISVPEQSGGALIPEGRLQPGTLHTISMGTAEMPGTFRLEIQNIAGGGKFRPPARHQSRCGSRSITSRPTRHGSVHRSSRGARFSPPPRRASECWRATSANARQLHRALLGGLGACRSVADGGNGRHEPRRNGGSGPQSCRDATGRFDAGAKKILLPMSSVVDIPTVPGELFAKFQTSFYSDPVDAVFKAIGVE